MDKIKVIHGIPPVYDKNSRILMLGSIPSPKSRETVFFYGHPQNRFWKVLGAVLKKDIPVSIQEKKKLLLDSHIALWDVIQSCEICGASDATIKNARANDLAIIFDNADIKCVFTTGRAAYRYYMRFFGENTVCDIISLPSTSAANCANYTLTALEEEYKKILQYL